MAVSRGARADSSGIGQASVSWGAAAACCRAARAATVTAAAAAMALAAETVAAG